MKRTFAKRSFQALAAMFFLVGGLMLTATRAEAQQSLSGGYSNLNWVGTSEAVVTLTTTIQAINGQLPLFIPGTQQYNDAAVRAAYYKNVYSFIDGGDPVSVAVPKTTGYMGGHGPAADGTTAGLNVSKQLLATIEAEAIQLLTN